MDQQTTNNTSLTSLGWDAFSYATWRNPFFTARIGAGGWDPARNRWLSKLNRVLAPGADRDWDLVRQVQARMTPNQLAHAKRVERVNMRDARVGGGVGPLDDVKTNARRGLARTQSLIQAHTDAPRAARALGFRNVDDAVIAARSRGSAWFVGLTGEVGRNRMDSHLAARARHKFGGFKWIGRAMERGTTHAALAYGAGRLLTGLNFGLLAYDAGRLALKPFEWLAEVGVSVRSTPTVTTGAGLRAPSMAASVRSQAVAEMQSSAWAPRNMIGNEAGFLHV